MYQQAKQGVLQDFAKSLVEAKGMPNFVGLDKQCEILKRSCSLSSEEFADYFTGLIKEVTSVPNIFIGDEELPNLHSRTNRSEQVFPTALQPKDFGVTSPQNAVALYRAWCHVVGIESATCEEFWFSVTLNELRQETIGAPWWLLASGKSNSEKSIKAAVNEATSKKQAKKVDDLVRRLVRNTAAGATAYRGQPALYSNCSLARTYWIGKLACLVASTELETATMLADPKQWGEFADHNFTKKRFQVDAKSVQEVAKEVQQVTVIEIRESAIVDSAFRAWEQLLKAA